MSASEQLSVDDQIHNKAANIGLAMSLLLMNSYLNVCGYKPQVLDDLDNLLIKTTEKESSLVDPKLAGHIMDMSLKLGFILLAKDTIDAINGKHQYGHIHVNYYLFNFIYDTKAFLDSVAVTVNDRYNLGFSGGEIDLKWDKFRAVLNKNKSGLGKAINIHESWIKKVVVWRESLIHKFSTLVTPYMEKAGEPTEEDLKQLKGLKMAVEPIPIWPSRKDVERLQNKYGSFMQDIMPFCEEWSEHCKSVFESTCNTLYNDLKG